MMSCSRCGTDSPGGVSYCAACGASLANPSDVSRGVQVEAVLGSYRLLKQIGEGGMGRVFVAEHTRLGRKVAVKVLRSEYAGNIEAVKRFFAEARAVNLIKHENIIEISDFVENDDGHSYYIMELLQGHDLRRLLDREQILPVPRAVQIALQMARALSAAHAVGIIHRDLKPDNVYIIERGERQEFVKLLDFGVAKLLNPNEEQEIATFKTNAGIIVGTPDYMSPEQGAGKPFDHRTDVYSLGVVVFEMVTGQRPFRAESFGELMIQHMTVAPPRPSTLRAIPHSLPPALERLILACLEKEPAARPQDMQAVERALEAIARGEPDDDSASPEQTAIRKGRRRGPPWLVWFACAGALGLAVSSIIWLRWRPVAVAGHQREAPAGLARPAEPASAAAPATRAVLRFQSEPPGAAVFAAGGTEPLGLTPFSIALPASSHSETFEFRLEGYRPERRRVPLLDGNGVEVALAVVAPVPAPPSQVVIPPRTSSRHRISRADRGGVLNPFK